MTCPVRIGIPEAMAASMLEQELWAQILKRLPRSTKYAYPSAPSTTEPVFNSTLHARRMHGAHK